MAGITIEETTQSAGFTFDLQPNRPFASFTSNTEVAQSLEKWGLPAQGVLGQYYRCGTVFRRGMAHEYLVALFNDPSFAASFAVTDGKGGLRPANLHNMKVRDVRFTQLRATATSLDVLDKFEAAGVVREGGGIVRCMDIFQPGGVTVANLLRAYFMVDEDEWPDELALDCNGAEILTPDERSEFLVHVLHRVVAGGALCQWDDDMAPYKDAVRSLYKDMVVVGKRLGGGSTDPDDVEGGSGSGGSATTLEVQSLVYQVHAAVCEDGTEVPLFPRGGDGRAVDSCNYMYVAIHPHRRELTVWYHGFWSPF